jgi:hypothetical protein
MQGYLFGKPVPLERIEVLLADGVRLSALPESPGRQNAARRSRVVGAKV